MNTCRGDMLLALQRLSRADCGDNSCLFGGKGKGGMRTNGGCRCYGDLADDICNREQALKDRIEEWKRLYSAQVNLKEAEEVEHQKTKDKLNNAVEILNKADGTSASDQIAIAKAIAAFQGRNYMQKDEREELIAELKSMFYFAETHSLLSPREIADFILYREKPLKDRIKSLEADLVLSGGAELLKRIERAKNELKEAPAGSGIGVMQHIKQAIKILDGKDK